MILRAREDEWSQRDKALRAQLLAALAQVHSVDHWKTQYEQAAQSVLDLGTRERELVATLDGVQAELAVLRASQHEREAALLSLQVSTDARLEGQQFSDLERDLRTAYQAACTRLCVPLKPADQAIVRFMIEGTSFNIGDLLVLCEAHTVLRRELEEARLALPSAVQMIIEMVKEDAD